ncbi:substrate-binding domain-containing protein [Dysgonomonas sp. Marseille-P4677]|uniref:LacI family DNA-binding transcriptional regulator n=1 Tax=Dysgonomonas sp. Marseille-P4677 TaxID=2364790 RepID=UPI001913A67F|nr:substrate-binding domain-containing protein [Dysgonomonas sp. Marseille-P4677]MBK5720479.1 substrate-binding domain-containing protein [Dysgonomonas sp. Marseille-P4677]
MKKDNTNIRIVDIAKLAGVSTGTVDRVLHKRGRVSEEKRAKVEQILKEINYEPNLVARFLASKRSYKFAVIAPTYSEGDYWELVCNGIDRAESEMKKFNISVEYIHFNQYDRESFREAVNLLKGKEYDGVLLATLFGELVINLSKELDEKEIPYIYIDSDIIGQNDLAYFGGDSLGSGNIAAKLLLKEIGINANIFIAHIRFKYKEISVQMKTRELGFIDCLKKSGYKGKIHHIEINPDDYSQTKKSLEDILSKSDSLVGGIVLNSRIYELVSLLNKIDKSLSERTRLIGHDAIERNVNALKNGQVSFILSQRPELQGYDAIKALANYFLFKQLPQKTNFMPIDILIKENIDYYNNYKL